MFYLRIVKRSSYGILYEWMKNVFVSYTIHTCMQRLRNRSLSSYVLISFINWKKTLMRWYMQLEWKRRRDVFIIIIIIIYDRKAYADKRWCIHREKIKMWKKMWWKNRKDIFGLHVKYSLWLRHGFSFIQPTRETKGKEMQVKVGLDMLFLSSLDLNRLISIIMEIDPRHVLIRWIFNESHWYIIISTQFSAYSFSTNCMR